MSPHRRLLRTDLSNVSALLPVYRAESTADVSVGAIPAAKVIEVTVPLALGAQDVTVNGGVARKLNALWRVWVEPPWRICENDPTAYMVPPH